MITKTSKLVHTCNEVHASGLYHTLCLIVWRFISHLIRYEQACYTDFVYTSCLLTQNLPSRVMRKTAGKTTFSVTIKNKVTDTHYLRLEFKDM